MDFVTKLRQKIRTDIFSSSDVKSLLSPITDASVHNGISRAIKSKDIVQLRRGLYLFGKDFRRNSVSKFMIANKLYAPSYVSFESALSIHGLIPEAVYTTTSACFQRKKKSFKNDLGAFSFNYIPCEDFFLGVTYLKSSSSSLVASPLRALFDYIYLYKKTYQTFDDVISDIRIDKEALNKEMNLYKLNEIEQLAELYKKNNVRDFFNLLIREFK